MKKAIVLGLVVALAILGGFIWHSRQPTQKINGTIDQLFDTVAHQKIFSPAAAEVKESLREVFADEVALSKIDRFPGGTLSFNEIFNSVRTFQNFTTLCEFAEIERSVAIVGDRAQAFRTTTVAIAAGPDSRTEQTYDFTFDLENTDRWRITAIRAQASSP